MKKIYDRINYELFACELPQDVVVQKMTLAQCLRAVNAKCDGLCIFNGNSYFIGIADHLTDKEKFDTLVHEMIHVWQTENNKKEIHGKYFKLWCQKAIDLYY